MPYALAMMIDRETPYETCQVCIGPQGFVEIARGFIPAATMPEANAHNDLTRFP